MRGPSVKRGHEQSVYGLECRSGGVVPRPGPRPVPEERVPEDHPVHYIRQLVAEELGLSPIF